MLLRPQPESTFWASPEPRNGYNVIHNLETVGDGGSGQVSEYHKHAGQLHTREIYFVNKLYNQITHTVRVLFWLVVYLVIGRVEHVGGLGGEAGGGAAR